MKKNKIIELIGGLSIAVAGIAAVISGFSNRIEETKADHTMSVKIKGDFTGSWAEINMNWSDTDSKYIYSTACTKGQQFGFTIEGTWKGFTSELWTYGWKIAKQNGSNFEIAMDGTFTFGVDESKNISAWFTTTKKVYIESNVFTNAHIYGGASGDKTSWPGVSLYAESDTYLRNGSNATLKYAVLDNTWDSTTIIFNNNNDKQTNNLSISANAVYTSGDGSNFGKDTNCTDALAFIKYWRTLRKNGSICTVYNDETKRNEVYLSFESKAMHFFNPETERNLLAGPNAVNSKGPIELPKKVEAPVEEVVEEVAKKEEEKK